MEPVDFIKSVRMLRAERGLNFEDAKQVVLDHFRRKGWEVPFAFKTAAEREGLTTENRRRGV